MARYGDLAIKLCPDPENRQDRLVPEQIFFVADEALHDWAERAPYISKRRTCRNAMGEHQTHPVLLALKEMQAAGALAAARHPRLLFVVAPELEAARQALAAVGVEPLVGGGEGEAGEDAG